MSSIKIQKIGVTKLAVDAVVNAANDGLWEGGGVSGAIFREAGSAELNKVCKAIGHCDTGNAVITPGFNLKAKYIIHAVGPVYRNGKNGEKELLYSAYSNSLKVAKENGCHSIGFPLISAGIYGYPKKEAFSIAIKACRDFVQNDSYEMDIIFAVLDDNVIAIGQDILNQYNLDAKGKYVIRNNAINGKSSEGKGIHQVTSRSTQEDRIKIFNDTLDMIKSSPELVEAVDATKKATKIFYENDYPIFDSNKTFDTIITVSPKRSYQAAIDLKAADNNIRVAVMNFANAFHAGGGVEYGSSAQEECLCRTSTLHPCIYRKSLNNTFYKHHMDLNDPKATDSLIYTPGIKIIKTDVDFPERLPKDKWVDVDVITIAAPDLRTKPNIHANIVGGGTHMNDAELFGYHVKRAIHMLTCAASMGANALILGAFGCGAFENNPEVVARAYKVALQEFPNVFKQIEFAVYCSSRDSKNYDIFKKILE